METENQYLLENECAIGYPGVKQTLEALAKNHRLFIASNSQRGYPELCIAKLGLDRLIRGHICYGDTGKSKGESIRTLMNRHHITSACYIGDTQGDADAAKAAGIPFIWAAYGFGTVDRFDAKIDDIRQLSP